MGELSHHCAESLEWQDVMSRALQIPSYNYIVSYPLNGVKSDTCTSIKGVAFGYRCG